MMIVRKDWPKIVLSRLPLGFGMSHGREFFFLEFVWSALISLKRAFSPNVSKIIIDARANVRNG